MGLTYLIFSEPSPTELSWEEENPVSYDYRPYFSYSVEIEETDANESTPILAPFSGAQGQNQAF